MISVIISSARRDLLNDVSNCIKTTIGVPYELIAIENSNGEMGICEVYNLGIEQAKYDLLCFMHEDLEIKTCNWGAKVLSAFEYHQNLGVLGVAGCAYKTFAPSGWDTEGNEGGVRSINYIQGFKSSRKPAAQVYFNSKGENTSEVACVDGMWFCVRKSVALEHLFDSDLLKGFHGYDLDFCLNVGRKYQVAVTFDVLMEHFSEGNFSKEWLIEILKVHQKWKSILPVSATELRDRDRIQFEKRAYKRLIKMMIGFKFKKGEILSHLVEGKKSDNIPLMLFLKLNFYLLKL